MQQYCCLSLLLLLLGISCNSESSSHSTNSPTNSKLIDQDTLRAILHLKDTVFESSLDAYVEVTILNKSNKTYTIKAAELQQPILAVQVFDAQNKLVPSIPPSVPHSDKNSSYISIKPMEAFITTYDLHIFDPLLVTGKYTIMMKNMPSNQVSFEINTSTND